MYAHTYVHIYCFNFKIFNPDVRFKRPSMNVVNDQQTNGLEERFQGNKLVIVPKLAYIVVSMVGKGQISPQATCFGRLRCCKLSAQAEENAIMQML